MLTSPTSKRDLITEISSLLYAHEMHIENQRRLKDNAQNNNKLVTERKEYQPSPLGRREMGESRDNPQSPPNQPIEPSKSAGQEEDFKFRKYKNNNEIAHHCQKLLKVTAYPSVAQITLLIHQIVAATTGSPSELNSVKSIVLQWFRKRREYLASKVYSVCDELMGDVWMAVLMRAEAAGCGPLSYDSTVDEIISDGALMTGIFHASDLPIKDEINGVNFVKRKVKDYFTKLCSKIVLKPE